VRPAIQMLHLALSPPSDSPSFHPGTGFNRANTVECN
jgi:hypothetical protein